MSFGKDASPYGKYAGQGAAAPAAPAGAPAPVHAPAPIAATPCATSCGQRMTMRRLLVTSDGWQQALPVNGARGFFRVAVSTPSAAVVEQTGVAFDGQYTTGHQPALSNEDRTASYLITTDYQAAFVLSRGQVVSGKRFAAFRLGLSAPLLPAKSILIAICNSTFDVNAHDIPAAQPHMIGLLVSSDSGVAVVGPADVTYVRDINLTDGQIFLMGVDIESGTWQIMLPNGDTLANLQDVVGLWHGLALGRLPVGPYLVGAGPADAEVAAGTATLSATLLTDAELVAAGVTAWAGYDNVTNTITVSSAVNVSLDSQGGDFETVLPGAPLEPRVAPENAVYLRAAADPANPTVKQQAWVTVWEGA
jgi:hypothetical protein